MKKIIFLATWIGAQIAFSQNTISTVAGTGMGGYSGDNGAATSAKISLPSAVACDVAGNLYIADHSGAIRKVDGSGIITTIAGTGVSGFSGDGGLATLAQIADPTGIAFDASGNMFIADRGNKRIRKVDVAGIITTYAGDGTWGYGGDGGAAISAQLQDFFGIATDAAGNLYIADDGNNRIRKVNTSGVISTVAGTGTANFSGDGGLATAAELNGPAGVAFDALGNMYISDSNNSRVRIVNASGIINTIVGTGNYASSGDEGLATAAEIRFPDPVVVDAGGNIFIPDVNSHRIRKVSNTGIITTVAGNGVEGYSGDGGAATLAELDMPEGVTVDGQGNLFIADYFNMRIRKVANVSGIKNTQTSSVSFNAYPNPAKDQLLIEAGLEGEYEIELFNTIGENVIREKFNKHAMLDVAGLKNGIYVLFLRSARGAEAQRIVIAH